MQFSCLFRRYELRRRRVFSLKSGIPPRLQEKTAMKLSPQDGSSLYTPHPIPVFRIDLAESLERPSLRPTDAPAFRPFPYTTDEIKRAADRHPAVHHRWLQRIAMGSYANPELALRDFAIDYCGYSDAFPRFLQIVIDKLDDPAHRARLQSNLDEERGHLADEDRAAIAAAGIDPATVDGVAHPILLRRFCRALNVSDLELQHPSEASRAWTAAFLEFLESASPAAAVGALGLGTEGVVRPIYSRILSGLRGLGLSREDTVFFDLHCTVDDQHAIDLCEIAEDLAVTPIDRAELHHGMLRALELRHAFWDHLDAQATGRAWRMSA
jgi:pyrroloquinoline quinone (PQQ) biosynthesis protein C